MVHGATLSCTFLSVAFGLAQGQAPPPALQSTIWPKPPTSVTPQCLDILEIYLLEYVLSSKKYALHYLLRAAANMTSCDLQKFYLNKRV